jgi:long-chain acyl-CoA synthetase
LPKVCIIGRFDADGFLYIADRVKDMILRGGFNVYPREFKEVLMTHKAVSLCAVIGTPHAMNTAKKSKRLSF